MKTKGRSGWWGRSRVIEEIKVLRSRRQVSGLRHESGRRVREGGEAAADFQVRRQTNRQTDKPVSDQVHIHRLTGRDR